MPHTRIVRIPVSDQTAAEAKVGEGARVVVSGKITEISASRQSEGISCGPCESESYVWPAEITLEISSANLQKANPQMEMLMDDEEGD